MARTWLEITVELIGGGTLEDLWPRPGRTFVAARSHSFEQLAEAIDDAFGRWDLNHLHEFVLADGTCLGLPDPEWDEGRAIVHARRVKLSRLAPGERFAYVFDLGDHWTHVCTVGPKRVDPLDVLGTIPPRPAAVFGWGDVLDQHGRRWAKDNGEGPMPADTQGRDLPPLLPGWERGRRCPRQRAAVATRAVVINQPGPALRAGAVSSSCHIRATTRAERRSTGRYSA